MLRKLILLFCSPQKIYKRDDVNLFLNGNKVEQISHQNFLGMYIDEYLNWEEHIKQISAKVSKKYWCSLETQTISVLQITSSGL